jgi:hypothetical protein
MHGTKTFGIRQKDRQTNRRLSREIISVSIAPNKPGNEFQTFTLLPSKNKFNIFLIQKQLINYSAEMFVFSIVEMNHSREFSLNQLHDYIKIFSKEIPVIQS